jgi:acetolactate synthase small subunit
MKRLNTEETKLKIIEQLIILNDDSVFEQIENLINESMQRPKPVKLTKQDIIERARLSNTDIENKDVYTINAVEKSAQRW